MTDSKPHTAPDRPRVAIVGAGVNGLGIAWRLAQAGCPVTVFEAGAAGRGASWAAAGMLAAAAEAEPGESDLVALGRQSQTLWPDFAEDLRAASGLDPAYRDEGLLIAALTRDEAEKLRFDHDFLRARGLPVSWLSAAELRQREPHLSRHVVAGLSSPEDHQVDNRRLVTALHRAAVAAGATVREHTPVTAIETAAGRASGLVAGGESHAADVVVLAAGAWSRDLPGLPEAVRPPVRPIKGQMLALRMDPSAPLLRHVLWAPTAYLVPRRDGRLIVGGTVEERGFDETLTAGGVYALLEAAWRAIPAIEELPIDEFWVGFRPGSRDDAPILGPSELDGLWLATGHHRNGILLAPLTAAAVSAAILGRPPVADLSPFAPARFTAGAATPDPPARTA